jgi:hypothetical protein
MGWTAKESEVLFPTRARDVCFLHNFEVRSVAHVAYTVGTDVRFPGRVKRQGREIDSPPFSAEVKNGGAISALHSKSSWRVVSNLDQG